MKILLLPAIALMNRFSFASKFSFICVLFFVPMLVTGVYLVRDAYQQYHATENALSSLVQLKQSLLIRRDLESLNDLARLNAVLGQSDQGVQLEQQITSHMQTLNAGFERLNLAAADDLKVQETLSDMQRLLAQAQNQSSLQNQAALIEQLLGSSHVLIKVITSQAGLRQDPQRQVRELSELISNITPIITEVLSQGRALGASALGQGFLNSASSDQLDTLLELLDKLQTEYELNLQQALADYATGELSALAQQSRDSLKQSVALLEEHVVMADTLEAPWSGFYQQLSEQIQKTYAFNDALLAELDQLLQGRLADKRLHMALLISALILVLGLIGYFYGGFYYSTRSTLRGLGRAMDKVAAGDMTVSLSVHSRDELGQLASAFNQTVVRIHQLIERVGQSVTRVNEQATAVAQVSAQSYQAVDQQREQIEHVASAMNEMSATAQDVARSASGALTSAQQISSETASGREQVNVQVGNIEQLAAQISQSVQVVNQLAADSAAISGVLVVIKAVAEQTNLLALNAAIEAARAGEQGRGFAVVADEVRNLAKRTQSSTAEIEAMIDRVQGGVAAAVKTMNSSHELAGVSVTQTQQVQQALENIVAAAGMVMDQNQQIAAAAEQQTVVAHEIDQNIVQISLAGEQSAQGAAKAEQASRELSEQVVHLQDLIGAFRV